MRERRLAVRAAKPGPNTDADAEPRTFSDTNTVEWMHDTRSVCGVWRRHLRERRVAIQRAESDARFDADSDAITDYHADANSPPVGRLHDAGSFLSSRRRHVRKRRMVSPRDCAVNQRFPANSVADTHASINRVYDTRSFQQHPGLAGPVCERRVDSR